MPRGLVDQKQVLRLCQNCVKSLSVLVTAMKLAGPLARS